MTSYTLALEFEDSGLDLLHSAGEKVVIFKAVGSTNGGSSAVWMTFKPAEHNVVRWTESYGLYASNTHVQNGATIDILSNTAAQQGMVYTFNDSLYFASPIPNSDPNLTNSYSLVNNSGQSFTFGLSQTVLVNGQQVSSVLNAVTVPNGQRASFTPIIALTVGASATLNNGAIATDLSSFKTTVPYESGATSAKVKFFSQNSAFLIQE